MRIPALRAPIVRASMALQTLRPMPRFFSSVADPEVITPETADTLEWVLDSPPTLHQFEEPPIVVEIAHLM